MTKDALKKAYGDIAKAERASLNAATQIIETALREADSELKKFPEPAPQSSGIVALQHLRETLLREQMNVTNTLGLYAEPDSESRSAP
jgi:hypothetical protein